MYTPLSAISNILSSGISFIESTYAKHGATFPSIDEPFQPGPLDEDEALSETIDRVIAAAAQLIALVKPVPRAAVEHALSFYLPASLNMVTEANIPEILREAGHQGLHIKDIGDRCGSDPHKTGRVLRYLATSHIFREVSPDVFANNRMSSVLDTGKSVAMIKADKHDNTFGIPALVGHCTDEMMKAAAYLADNLLDLKTTTSQEPLDSPLSRAFGRQHFFEFLEKPENEYRFRRFSAAMLGTIASNNSDAIMTGFDWKSLQEDALVVDVGGGVGSTTLQLMKAYPHLRYLVQDRPNVIANGIKFWENEDPVALKTGRVEFKAHDFFERQPIKDASVFFMRYITHDWPDAYVKKILQQLRVSAQSLTTLILCDYLVPYAAPSNDLFSGIPGAKVPTAPYPLLPNLGTISNQTLMGDLQMMTAFNSQERTIGQFIDLVDGTGWKLRSIGRNPQTAMTLLVFDTVTV